MANPERDVKATLITLRADLEKQIMAARSRRTNYAQLSEDAATEISLVIPELEKVRVLWDAMGMKWDTDEDTEEENTDG